VRLKEHGQYVLVLEKIPANIKTADGSLQVQYKYDVALCIAVLLQFITTLYNFYSETLFFINWVIQ